MIKVMHIITCLDRGGAEKVLFDLISNSNSDEFQHVVISLNDLGYYGGLLNNLGVSVYSLNLKNKVVTACVKFKQILMSEKPSLISGWLYHGNLFCSIAWGLGYRNIVWNIHNTYLPWRYSPKGTILINKLCVLMSWFIPRKIIYCGSKPMDIHVAQGYRSKISSIIYNGYSNSRFIKSNELRIATRYNLNLSNDQLLIGCVGRYDPAKDHLNLIRAINHLKNKNLGVSIKVIMIGRDIDTNLNIREALVKFDLLDDVILVGEVADVVGYYNAMDVYVLSSSAEAFPNVLNEAMLCELSCLTTDVGDASFIVGDVGLVVPPRDAVSLANGIETFLSCSKDELENRGRLSRIRVEQHFGLKKMVDNYEELYRVLYNL